MVKFSAFIKLIRTKNLLIILLVQIALKYCLINMFLQNFAMDNFIFSLYLIALTFIVASGYIINDIYDVETDIVNKKKNRVIEVSIKTEKAYKIYYLFNIIGVIAGFYVAYSIGKIYLGLIFLFYTLSLWKYSKIFKTSFIWGNLQVAFLIALSIMNLAFFDLIPVGNYEAGSTIIFRIILFYTLFSFITTLTRELIKDVEDIEGDKKIKAKTAPITLGIIKVKKIGITLMTITLIGILYFQNFQLKVKNQEYLVWGTGKIALIYVFMIQILLLFTIYKTNKSSSKSDFHLITILLKIIMLMGILTIPLFTLLHVST